MDGRHVQGCSQPLPGLKPLSMGLIRLARRWRPQPAFPVSGRRHLLRLL